MLTLAATGYGGQTNQLDLHHTGALPQQANGALAAPPRTNTVPRLFEAEKPYGGVLPDLKRRKGQFFKGPAPSSPRDFQNVSINPHTGQAEGIILFSLRF